MRRVIGNLLAVLLLVLPYLFWVIPGLFTGLANGEVPADGPHVIDEAGSAAFELGFTAVFVIYAVVVLANVIFLIYLTVSGEDAQRLLFWDMLIKLCYIPFFLMMFLMILAGFATFLVGGIAMVVMTVGVDLLFLIPPSIYGLCGCIRAAKEKNMSGGLSVVLAILHFLFCADVVAAIVAYCKVRSSNKKRQRPYAGMNSYGNGNMSQNGNTYNNRNGYIG